MRTSTALAPRHSTRRGWPGARSPFTRRPPAFARRRMHQLRGRGRGRLYRTSLLSIASIASVFSVLSLFSASSILSIGSIGSVLSIGSAGSILSIGSAGSILSIGSAGGILRIGGRRAALDRDPSAQPSAPPQQAADMSVAEAPITADI